MKACLIFVLLALGFAGELFAAPKIQPNIVFILADDLGYADLSCYGATDIKTPNLDRLANEGVRFTDFHANGCVCTPTRCALMTGRYQQRIGGLETAIPPGAKHLGLPPQEKTIATLLRQTGYTTALSGKWHLGYQPEMMPNAHGFDQFFGLISGNHNYFTHRENNDEADLYLHGQPVEMEGYSTHLITEHALKFLNRSAADILPKAANDKTTSQKYKPFLLYVAFNAPHFPFQLPSDKKHEITKAEFGKGSREIYAGMVEEMDKGIGKILEALDRDGLSGNTLVVFASDNGGSNYSRNFPLAKGKSTLWEGGIRVPCIARFPGRIPAGTESDQVGITMDWTATIAKLAGVKAPKNRSFEGIDLLPILSGQRKNVKRTLFWRSVDFAFVKKFRAVRDGDWKYIENYANGEKFLYNLTNDIGETENTATQNAKLTAALKKKLDQWEEDVDPPLYQAAPSHYK